MKPWVAILAAVVLLPVFVRHAIELAGDHYPEAEHDLRLVLYYKGQP